MALDIKRAEKPGGDRLKDLEANIRRYDPGFDFNEVRKALDIVKPRKGKERKSLKIFRDLFSDPLLILESLVAYANPDRETILAAILYPSIRPVDKSNGPDTRRLEYIQEEFGRPVCMVIEDTLRFRALKYAEPVFGAQFLLQQEKATKAEREKEEEIRKKEKDEHLRLFRLMGLWLARGRRAILIYTTQLMLNLQSESDKPGTFRPDKRDYMIRYAELVAAPLAYIAGYEKLREKLMDTCFKIKDPDGYAQTRRKIDDVIRRQETEEVKQVVIKKIEERFGWEAQTDFDVEIRPKPAASTHDKAVRKRQNIGQLGDICGVRIILHKSIIEGAEYLDLRTLKDRDRQDLYQELGAKCLHVYGILSNTFGRHNLKASDKRPVLDDHGGPVLNRDGSKKTEDFSYIRERIAELAIAEPRDKDPGRYDDDPERQEWEEKKYSGIKDARFDDYINRPKPSGYSAVQDTFFIPIASRDKPVEVECQIVDEMRHEHNMKGPGAGRVYFKSGLAKYTGAILDWYRLADIALLRRSAYKGPEKTLVLDRKTKKVVDISDHPTVAGFFAAAGHEATEACVYNGYDFHANSTPISPKTYGKSTILVCGSVVAPVGA